MEWQWVGLNGIGLDRYINIIIVIEELVRFASLRVLASRVSLISRNSAMNHVLFLL
jgi:hypothetical protein